MINEKDLRIGNVVNHRTGDITKEPVRWEPVIVTLEILADIKRDREALEEALKFPGTSFLPLYESVYEPLPITPEVLVKCGFEEVVEHDITWQHPSGFFIFEMWNKDTKQTDGFGISLMNKFNVYTNHLHQLQNLYHSLTGQELEYKP